MKHKGRFIFHVDSLHGDKAETCAIATQYYGLRAITNHAVAHNNYMAYFKFIWSVILFVILCFLVPDNYMVCKGLKLNLHAN